VSVKTGVTTIVLLRRRHSWYKSYRYMYIYKQL